MESSSAPLAALNKEIVGLLPRLLGPLCDEVGLALQESFRLQRLKNSVRILTKAQQILDEAGIKPEALSPRMIVPLLQSASLEEDEMLCDQWAALLAKSLDPKERHHVLPSFVSLLSQLSAPEAKMLDFLLDRWNQDEDRNGHLQARYLVEQLNITGPQYEVMSQNLIRLGLCRHFVSRRLDAEDGYDPDCSIHLTEFGIAFVEACRIPKKELYATDHTG